MEQSAGGNVVPLRAAAARGDLAERTFLEMLQGWRNQQLARNLAFATINAREAEVRRFVADAGEYPRRWSPQVVPAAAARSVRGSRRSEPRRAQCGGHGRAVEEAARILFTASRAATL